MLKGNRSKRNKNQEMSFFDHLEVLRFTFIRSISSIIIFSAIAFVFKDFVFNEIILGPQKAGFITNQLFCRLGECIGSTAICINQEVLKIINIELAGQFKTHLSISFFAGIVLAMPYVLFEMWMFLKPALRSNERKGSHLSLAVASILFFTGVAFGYYLLSPITVDFLSTYRVDESIENQIRLGSYIRTVTMLCLATGIAFEMPLVIVFLSANRIVSAKTLKKFRKHVVVFLFIISAVITPPDVISQFLVALPLLLLYEICIGIAKRIDRKVKS